MPSKATTVKEYLAEQPPDRRASLEAVRQVILENLDEDFEEGMQYGMIGYYVPHRVYPAGYHCDPKQPLPFAALGAQKGHLSLHLMCVYMNEPLLKDFQAAWKKSGKKLDMGKACVRFKTADDVALEAVGEMIRKVPAKKYIEVIEATVARGKGGKKASGKRATKKTAAKKTTKG